MAAGRRTSRCVIKNAAKPIKIRARAHAEVVRRNAYLYMQCEWISCCYFYQPVLDRCITAYATQRKHIYSNDFYTE